LSNRSHQSTRDVGVLLPRLTAPLELLLDDRQQLLKLVVGEACEINLTYCLFVHVRVLVVRQSRYYRMYTDDVVPLRYLSETENGLMTRSELIEVLTREQNRFDEEDVELAVKAILDQMNHALAAGERIEIRGFGAFSLHFRPPRMSRNPKTGEPVAVPGRYAPYFRPGKELRERVNGAVAR
jgi:integration host factor subunit beta